MKNKFAISRKKILLILAKCIGNYVAMWLLNYSGCGTFRDFESDIFMNFRLWVSLLVNLACTNNSENIK